MNLSKQFVEWNRTEAETSKHHIPARCYTVLFALSRESQPGSIEHFLHRSNGAERCYPDGQYWRTTSVRECVCYESVPRNKDSWTSMCTISTYAGWQGKFACQFSFKSSTFLTIVFKDNDSARWSQLIRKYLAHGERYRKHCYCQQIENLMRSFNWHIYIWPCRHSKGQGQGHADFNW